MAFGKRIKFFRNRKGMKQKELGELLGFLGKTSDVRVAQYETEARTPKADLVKEMAQIFGISYQSYQCSKHSLYLGLMHTLFALEDMYGIKIGEIDGELCLRLDREHREYHTCLNLFMHGNKWLQNWNLERLARKNTITGDITIQNSDTSEIRAKVPSQELSDELIKALKKEKQ